MKITRLFEDIFREIEALIRNLKILQRLRGFLRFFQINRSFLKFFPDKWRLFPEM
jgi:hypothetical protein